MNEDTLNNKIKYNDNNVSNKCVKYDIYICINHYKYIMDYDYE